MLILLFLAFSPAFSGAAWAAPINTNSVSIPDAPAWLKASRVDSLTDHMGSELEWDIRKFAVTWYNDEAAFEKAHGFTSNVLAVTRGWENKMWIGPKVTDKNFNEVFSHELVHMILAQKYKGAVPKWLEEGMANYFAKGGEMDYKWLASQPAMPVHSLAHPFSGGANSVRYVYMASLAVMQMIAAKCPIHDLLQLSLGSSLEAYLGTTCEIPDLDASFKVWVKKKAG